jgi:hypothetical protein
MAKLKLTFETKDVNGNPLTLDVRKPTSGERNDANMKRARSWHDAVQNKVIMRDKLDALLKDDTEWGGSRKTKLENLKKTIKANEIKILGEKASGLSKVELKSLAIETIKLRNELNQLSSQRIAIDNNTAESIAGQAEFNTLVAHCTVYNSGIHAGKRYFSSYEDYVERQNELVAIEASNKFYELEYGNTAVEEVEEPDSTEIKFLKKYKFLDDKGRLIDDKGRLIDETGRLINDAGRYINESGEYVDFDGIRVDEDGNFVVETVSFDDEEVASPSEEVVAEPSENDDND